MNNVPLPEKLRPQKLSEFTGQEHLVGKNGIIRKLLLAQRSSKKRVGHAPRSPERSRRGEVGFPSIFFWGPPGSGKTTLARIIAKELKRDFYEFSAVNTSTKEIQEVIKNIVTLQGDTFKGVKKQTLKLKSNQPIGCQSDKKSKTITNPNNLKPITHNLSPIIFLDEIHRFNKAQQDKLLPHVEKGEIILIGATTENPSFRIISPLMSRGRVLVLKQLNEKELMQIILRAMKFLKVSANLETRKFLVEASNGDARVALVVLEIAYSLSTNPHLLSTKNIEQALQKRQLNFDKKGEEYYNVISAFIKSMRASDVDAALYYLARMVEAGQDPLYIARRMVVFASEDVASPTALVVANAVFRACETIGYPECQENLAAGTVYLATAKKDRSAYDAYMKALEDVRTHGNLPVPMNLRNAPTKLMKELGYGSGYKMYSNDSLLPDKLKNKRYYKKS